MKIIVVGAGIVGAAIADQLALSGASVTILDRAGPGAGASSKSFGWINAAFAETPAYYRLRRAAIDAFRLLSEEIDLDHAVDWSGCLWWEDEGQAFDSHTAALEEHGYEAKVIDATEFAKLEPNVAGAPERCVLNRMEGAADGELVASALLRRATSNNAHVVLGREVTGLLITDSRVSGVVTDLGPVEADHVVCAAGAWSGALLNGSGINLPMDNKTGMIVKTQPVKPMIRHIIMSPDIHFRQTGDGRFVLGEIFSGGFQDGVLNDATSMAEGLLARLRRRLPDSDEIICDRINLGVRPVPLGGLPVIGPVSGLDALTIATMHSGVTLAPLVGRLVAEEVLGNTTNPLLDDFRLERFS